MRIFLTKASELVETDYLSHFRALVERDREGRYSLASRPEEADLILMTDIALFGDYPAKLETFSRHEMVRAALPNLFVYNELDDPWCSYQGLYCSMPASGFNRYRQRAVAYCHYPNEYVFQSQSVEVENPKWLFSFVGSNNVPVRRTLLGLAHPRGFILDSSAFNIYDDENRDGHGQDHSTRRMQDYVSILKDSKFVLCPRGLGTSSIRLFETLALGRVPVILSDDWVAPDGPDWSAFSLQVRERNASGVAAVIEAAEPRWEAMASAAKVAYHEWFARDILFHRMAQACLDIRKRAVLSEGAWRRLPSKQRLKIRMQWALKDIKARFHRCRE